MKTKRLSNRGLMMRSEKGFTLVELIITIALIAVVSAIAVPNVLVWRQNAELKGAARDVLSNFQLAKITAIERNTYCTITFSQAPAGYTLFVDANENLTYDGGEEVVKNVLLSEYGTTSFDTSQGGGDGLTFSNPTNGVAFASDGLPKSSSGFGSGSVFLKNDQNKTTSVILSSAGNIRLE
jgi:type IV fimbrial biogenesis protein FimT